MHDRAYAWLLALPLAAMLGWASHPMSAGGLRRPRHAPPARHAPDGQGTQAAQAASADVVAAATGALRYRMIGPHRGGRTKAAAGIPERPNVFYVGAVNGGVWKTTDYGRTWHPIFDDQPTGSIGAIAIAPSNPDIVYVGSGEGLQRPDLSVGDGIYRSDDGGRTWTHLGLRDGQQIPQIAVDPRSPDRLFVAVLGHPYGPNEERGLFRSIDGGRTFQKVLYRDPDTGAVDVVLDPSNPDIVYAALWEARQGPWENGAFSGPGSGLYKSTDGGSTWRQLTTGLPTFEADGLGRIGIAIAPSRPSRLFLTIDARQNGGLYRSDDGGESWTIVSADPRVTERGSDFAEVKVHPTNPDIVFTGSIVTWKSTDGGKTFSAFRGAPGGDDYHRIWINPRHPDVMLIASDQGVIVTVNGGETWSSWYNQPTAQFYHVIADNAFPYRVCGGQQESGSACVASRSDEGRITFRDWRPVGVEEYGYVAPDPLDPDIVYGGKLTRFDRRTGQVQNVAPSILRSQQYRVIRTMPVLFSPIDPKTLYFASNVLWKTGDGGRTWSEISPDLTRETWDVPAQRREVHGNAAGAAHAARRHLHDRALATRHPAAVGRHRRWPDPRDERRRPHVVERHADRALAVGEGLADGGLPRRSRQRVRGRQHASPRRPAPAHLPHARRRQDLDAHRARHPRRDDRQRRAGGSEAPGLLFAGTEQAVYVSLDDGDTWQSLRLNMPATSIRDLVDERRRPRRRHARAIVLDSRRHHAAAAGGRARARISGLPVRAAACHAGPLEHEHRYAAAARRARRAEPAGWRRDQLLPEGGGGRAGDARDRRRRRTDRSPLLQRRPGAAGDRRGQRAPLLDPAGGGPVDERRACTGSSGTCTSRRRRSRRSRIPSRPCRATHRGSRPGRGCCPGATP